jgi:DNA polymerase-3 subunit epsilon
MRSLCFFDLETTGFGKPDPDKDKIVEFALEVLDLSSGETFAWSELVNPGVVIPRERTDVHGISNEDVEGLPGFDAYAEMIESLVQDAVLVGYNSRAYDTPILDRELREAGRWGLQKDASGQFITHPEIDLYLVWRAMEPRSLEGAVARFTGRELGEAAHRAAGDAGVLREVLGGIARTFDLPDVDGAGPVDGGEIEALVEACWPEGAMDRAGCFRRLEDGTVVFDFSKNKGKPVASEPGMLKWMLKNDFPEETMALARRFLAAGRAQR